LRFSFSSMIQVAGIYDEKEAALLVKCGVTHLGFPLRLAYHQEDLTDREAAAAISRIKPPVQSVLITYLSKADEIAKLCRFLGVAIVQLHGEVALTEILRLKQQLPDVGILKSLIIRGEHEEEVHHALLSYEPEVDAFITDTWDPDTGACGATGKVHNWEISRRLVERSSKPVILAGGLNPENVRQAILTVRPAGVDAHTGLEGQDGRKDRGLVRKFVTEAKAAFREVARSDRSRSGPPCHPAADGSYC
jgi:phosphoribosylanthranilate isomerase